MTVPAYGLLLTDLYQLNMLQAYFDRRMFEPAVFELFVRKLPRTRNFLMAAGLEQAVDYLEGLRATNEEIAWLERSGRFSADFLAWLADLRFTGDVEALPEGTVFFPNEPVLRVTAPLPEAQLVETRLINLMHFQTVVASKAARMVLAAPGKQLIDFGLRRAHGAEAGLYAARAAYIAGFAGSATAVAAPLMDIPVFGTMAHSFILAHDDEVDAFISFARARPKGLVLLIDTYDTEAAAHKVVALAPKLRAEGITIAGVRLDSGDLVEHARQVRQILDAGGLPEVKIVASGGLDEAALETFTSSSAPIDTYGIGTSLVASSDAPVLDCAYKMQSYAGRPKRKLSEGKVNWPGAKQVFRNFDGEGRMRGDILGAVGETLPGDPLLQPVMVGGRRTEGLLSLDQARRNAAEQLSALPDNLRRLTPSPPYPLVVSAAVKALAIEADRAARPQ